MRYVHFIHAYTYVYAETTNVFTKVDSFYYEREYFPMYNLTTLHSLFLKEMFLLLLLFIALSS